MSNKYPADHPLNPDVLKAKQRQRRQGFATPLALRVHRALSWLKRSEDVFSDDDVRFILLWIGFNAAYAGDVGLAVGGQSQHERSQFKQFFTTLVSFDEQHRIYNLVWDRFSQEIRVLLSNQFVFAPFWHHQNGIPGYTNWPEMMEREHVATGSALRSHDTATILSILFGRLYVLRNQLVHGGATWNSAVNRPQVRDGSALLASLLPLFIDLMMDNPQHDWPMPTYPVVGE